MIGGCMDTKKIILIFSLLSVFNGAQASFLISGVSSLYNWARGNCSAQSSVDPRTQQLFKDLVDRNKSLQAYAVLAGESVDLNVTFANGETFLHRAVKAGIDPKIIKMMVERGADVNAKDAAGRTAYHVAESKFQSETMAALILAGANTEIRDVSGRTGKEVYEATHMIKAPQLFNYAMTPGSSSDAPSAARFALPTPSAEAAVLPGLDEEISVLNLGRAAVTRLRDVAVDTSELEQTFLQVRQAHQ
jgi:hypothetical protein